MDREFFHVWMCGGSIYRSSNSQQIGKKMVSPLRRGSVSTFCYSPRCSAKFLVVSQRQVCTLDHFSKVPLPSDETPT